VFVRAGEQGQAGAHRAGRALAANHRQDRKSFINRTGCLVCAYVPIIHLLNVVDISKRV